jgi:hypothetical protein
VHYSRDRIRANFTYHTGDIVTATWADRFTNVQEANVGLRLGGNWWVDAGLFRTHIGGESFLPKNIRLSSTAFATFNEPFYQAGARLRHTPDDRWHLEAWLLNGYNQFVDDNRAKSLGLLLEYAPNEATTLTYNNLIGNEAPDNGNRRQLRFYQNAYWEQRWNDRFSSLLSVDLGVQSNSELVPGGREALLYAALLTLRYRIDDRWSLTGRGELFRDRTGFISGTLFNSSGRPSGAKLTGWTLGGEYRPYSNAYLRAEGRYTAAADGLRPFPRKGSEVGWRWEVLLTFGVFLEQAIGVGGGARVRGE